MNLMFINVQRLILVLFVRNVAVASDAVSYSDALTTPPKLPPIRLALLVAAFFKG